MLRLLLAALAIQAPSFGPAAAWHPPADFRDRVLAACGHAGGGISTCFSAQMKAAGAPPEALAFSQSIGNVGYMEAFRPVRRVGVAAVIYPFRANENNGLFLITAEPPGVDVDNLRTVPQDQMKADSAYAAVFKSHPSATLWPGDRSSPDGPLALIPPDGGQQFLVDYRVQDGCHACAVLGQAFFSFNFDRAGKFLGASYSGFSPHYAFSRTTREKVLSVRPGATFTVALPANPSTGYSWNAVPAKASPLQVISHKYEALGDARPGAGGQELWTFRAGSQSGGAALNLNYRRPWEKNVTPARTIALTVYIR